MSQIMQVASGQPPVIPQVLMDQYNQAVAVMGEGFGGSLNFIRPGKMDFTLVENGVARQVANGQVVGVLLGLAPHDFCTWYEKAYTPGQEPEQPDLVWEWPDKNKFPDALPAQFREKQLINGKPRWAFRVARRSVWALVSVNQSGQPMLNLQSPYILDITSMSMYGQGQPQAGTYKFAGLMSMCQRLSQPPHFMCSPSMFLTQILLDSQSPVSGVVLFRPQLDNGQLQYLDNDTFQQVLQMMFSQTVQDMLKVKEKLSREAAPVAPQQPAPMMSGTPVIHVGGSNAQQAAPATPPGYAGVLPQQPVQHGVDPVLQAAPTQPVTAPSEDLLAQAQAALNNPQPQKMQVAPGVNNVTANALNALDNIL